MNTNYLPDIQKAISEWKTEIYGQIALIMCTPKTKKLLDSVEFPVKVKIIEDFRLEEGMVYLITDKHLKSDLLDRISQCNSSNGDVANGER